MIGVGGSGNRAALRFSSAMKRRTPALLILPLATALSACGTGERYEQALKQSKVSDAVSAYEEARLGGDPLNMCVKARLVAVAYEDARRNTERDAWKAKEAADCAVAKARYRVE